MLEPQPNHLVSVTESTLLDRLIASSAAEHGHLCPGQAVGVRMALLGMRLIGLELPLAEGDIKKLIVYVEMDRCTADAVAHASGARLGRRSLKFIDCGIMAATFVNLATGRAIRVVSTEESRDLIADFAPLGVSGTAAQIEAYKRMPDHLMFRIQEVKVELTEFDLPGPTRVKVVCEECGQVVRDRRERIVENKLLCRHCAGEGYFRVVKEIQPTGDASN